MMIEVGICHLISVPVVSQVRGKCYTYIVLYVNGSIILWYSVAQLFLQYFVVNSENGSGRTKPL